jgi:hypothetical protein
VIKSRTAQRIQEMNPDSRQTDNFTAQNIESSHNSADPSPPAAGTSEDSALATLNNAEVTAEALTLLGRDPVAAKNRKVAFRLVSHPRTPRHIAIPLLRRMFTFDLMQVTLTPVVSADIKRAAEEQLLIRLESLSSGQKITLARRASGRVAAELLRDSDARIISPALDNALLTESLVVRALMRADAPRTLFGEVAAHAKWSPRREVQIALLRSERTPVQRARELAKLFSEKFLREILPASRCAALGVGPGS